MPQPTRLMIVSPRLGRDNLVLPLDGSPPKVLPPLSGVRRRGRQLELNFDNLTIWARLHDDDMKSVDDFALGEYRTLTVYGGGEKKPRIHKIEMTDDQRQLLTIAEMKPTAALVP